MDQKLAIKRLTASDLTFFHWHFLNRPAGNQKAINLNADVFISILYPSLPALSQSTGGRIPIDLYIFGPGLQDEINLQRKIIKGGTYKNWRLDGEFVDNPLQSPSRFNSLAPGDIVIFEFVGDVQPTIAKAVFVAKALSTDTDLHSELDGYLADRAMASISASVLEELVAKANPTELHPVFSLVLRREIEDAALGGIEGIERLRSGPYKGTVSHEALKRARENAGRIGRVGEEFANTHLSDQKQAGEIIDFQWVSESNAISPYDFSVEQKDGSVTHIDVKSTEGDFNAPIHISTNELLQMAEATRYDIYRVYKVTENTALLRIALGINKLARDIINVLNQLPSGVRPDGVSIDPSIISFGAPITLSMPQVFDEE